MNGWPFPRLLSLIAKATAGLLCVAILAGSLIIYRYDRLAVDLQQNALPELQRWSDVLDGLSRIHRDLISLMAKARLKPDEQAIYLEGRQLLDGLDQLGTKVSANAEASDEHIRNIAAEWNRYRLSSSTAIEMLTVDPGLSNRYLLDAALSQNALNRQIAAHFDERHDEIAQDLADKLEAAERIAIIGMGSLFVLGLAIFLLIRRVTGSVGSKFSFIATSLDQLRQGNIEIAIPKTPDNHEYGKVLRGLAHFRDALTDLNTSRRQLAEQNHQLQEEIAERHQAEDALRNTLDQLHSAMQSLKASNQARTLFLGNMSHEFRTPLNHILGALQLIERRHLPDTERPLLEMADDAAHKLLSMINDLLNFVDRETMAPPLEPDRIIIRQLVDEILADICDKAARKGLTFTTRIAETIPTCLLGDKIKIGIVLHKLCDNAVKFTEHGEVCLNIEMAADQTQWILTISDTGPGMDAALQQRIFEAFTQADDSLHRRHDGLGIGLSLCRRLVGAMSGTLELVSQSGVGTTVRVVLPVDHCPEQ